jgi:hypothetical protein
MTWNQKAFNLVEIGAERHNYDHLNPRRFEFLIFAVHQASKSPSFFFSPTRMYVWLAGLIRGF